MVTALAQPLFRQRSAGASRQVLEIIQVLETGARLLVRLQISQADDGHRHAIDLFVIGLADLKTNKKASARFKDLDDLEHLS